MVIRKTHSVQNKITSLVFLVSMLVLVMTTLQFVLFELKHKRDMAHDDIRSLSELISANAKFPMTIKDYIAVDSLLDSLTARDDVTSAYLLLPNGRAVAAYSRSQNSHAKIDSVEEMKFLQIEARHIAEGIELKSGQLWDEKDRLAYLMPISFEGSHVGYTYLSVELLDVREHQLSLLLGWLLSLGVAMLVTYFLSVRLQKHISGPVEQLASQMQQISHEKRIVGFKPQASDDEFNLLFHGFEEMIKALKERDRMLEAHRKELELEVQVRTRALETEKEKAEQATIAKSRFLANMSHEIRTPMIGVLGMADILRQKELAEQDHKLVETIYRSGDALLTLINDILDFSKVEAGRLEIEAVPVDLVRLTYDVARLMEVSAHSKGLEIVVQTSGELPVVDGDPSRIRQILVNLIGNAVKFTEHGKITISVSSTTLPAEELSDWLFVIQDTGVGISPEALPRIFDSFGQGDSSTTRKYGGTGLGLAICKELILLMGGQITVASQPGEGSAFSVQLQMPLSKQSELPLSVPERSGLPESTALSTPPVTDTPLLAEPVSSGSRHVLLAEDNPTTQSLISILLQQMGIELTIVDDGQAAVDFLSGEEVDLIFMDCQMPNMDGFEATAQIRGQGVSTPIVALTAYARTEDEEQCLAAGMSDFLSKPFRQSELKDVLVRWLGADALSKASDPNSSVH